MSDAFAQTVESVWRLFNGQAAGMIDLWLLLFARTIAFTSQAPIFGRKDVPTIPKIALAMFLTTAMFMPMAPGKPLQAGLMSGMSFGHFFILIMVNVVIGLMIAFLARMILETVSAAGGLMNNQIGLSAANMLDPTTRQQNALMGPLFNYLGVLIYFQIGGVELLLKALIHSVEKFPLLDATPDIFHTIKLGLWTQIAGDILGVGLLIVGPFFVVTLAIDIMLGIVNKTAQQIPIFQLSAATKPVVGLLIFLLVLPTMLDAIRVYLMQYARLF